METKRNTIQRQLVYNAVKELDIHANAEQVYEHIITVHPSISRATVYRNLNQLAESGELLNIGSFYGTTHYDHNANDHYHFICEKCKHIYDISNCFPEIKNLTQTNGLIIKSHNLSFFGICNECK
ncbi:MAG: transcriptional repressor [Oscillospiraceae bacterium]|nr:transcriptional repressor [Oscillospiraceae bacterium]